MTNAQLMQEGINLMISGMGFVLVFLLILIFAIGLMSKIINQYFPEPISPTPTAKPTQSIVENDVDHLRPIIVAAIAHHRRQKGLN
ncbi:oxaloacetate decarboxylase gamma subunit [Bisgaardia hudsonensis]|uniref:Probable oxaloacetate decarboxylase gamma chain n=1 Tax=Bisgaardia hudsonensis TaxID=109472 RepID=A0A4R2MZV2_9PAST|nr:oxaloacetate decarboxylase subunit gamma [Bisgaardia hudsonensis]QLB13860.1 oxaloacetate decarboxylase gamma chain [Bisgaardia hudsonensis]TCP11655.1 oxaloacetate decarboxylase gamma subunit [Bisgaardia hudsonensis]